jgi:hypothetical protein
MLKVVFCQDGQAISDFRACDFADGTIKEYQRTCVGDQDMMVRFSTECVLDAFVLRTMEDEVLAKNIEFYYQGPDVENDIQMEFNEYRGLKLPDGVDEIGTRSIMVRKIVRLGVEKIMAQGEGKKEN